MNLVVGAVGINFEEDSHGSYMLGRDIQILLSGGMRRLPLWTIIEEEAVLQQNWSAVGFSSTATNYGIKLRRNL